MKDPIHELHFVPFETALRLRDAGYNEESLFVYRYDTETKANPELVSLGSPKKNIVLKKYSTVAALTYEEALTWLKDKNNFIVSLFPVENAMLEGGYEGYSYVERIYHIINRANGTVNVNIVSEDSDKKPTNDYYKSLDNCINLILNLL